MKKYTFICLLIASLHARADLVMVQSVDNGEKKNEFTTEIKDGKLRSNAGDQMRSTIMDMSTGESITLLHFQALYIKHPAGKALQGNDAKSPVPADTGKSEKVSGYETEIYTAETADARYTYWITKNYPDFKAVIDELKKLRTKEKDLPKTGNVVPDLTNMDGVVIKSAVTFKDGKTLTTTLISAKIQAVDDSEFVIPKTYNEYPDEKDEDATPAPSPASTGTGGAQKNAATPAPEKKK